MAKSPTDASNGVKRWQKRSAHKLFSYRYRVTEVAGPPDEPIVEKGVAIIESRYRGRTPTWQFAWSMMSLETFTVGAVYAGPAVDEEGTLIEAEMRAAAAAGPAVEAASPAAPERVQFAPPKAKAKPVPAPAPAPPPRVAPPVPPKRLFQPTNGAIRKVAPTTDDASSLATLGRALFDTAFRSKRDR